MYPLEERIIDAANKYKGFAEKLKDINEQHIFDDSVPEDIGPALIRLYYAEYLETEKQKCEDLLNEDTDEETVEAISGAANTIYDALEDVYLEIESYAGKDRDFGRALDEITEDSSNEGLHSLLYKLYRCGSIIRDAYDSSMSLPLYGPVADDIIKPKTTDPDITGTQEDNINRRLGIDIYRLLEIKQGLLDEINRSLGGPENMDKYINTSEVEY